MRGRGGVPRELVAGASSAVACRRERLGVVEQLSERSAQPLDVPRRHHASGAEAIDDLAEASDVVDDRRDARAQRLQERSGLVELRPVGKDGDRRIRQGALELLRAEIPEPPLGPSACGLPELLEGNPGIAGDEQAGPVDGERGANGVRKPLVGPDHAGREHRPAVVGPRRVAAEDGMGDDAQLLRAHAVSRQRVAPALGVDDNAVEAVEQPPPEPVPAGRAPWDEVVRGEDERPARPEQEHVELGHGEPLQVEDVGAPGEKPAHPDRVLERLGRAAQPASVDGARSPVEPVDELVPVRCGPRAEPERRRDELDRRPRVAERRGELVVVRRRERWGVGEDDVHRRRATTVPVASAAGEAMQLVVRTWNVFHGNAHPPRQAGYLRRMVELVTGDGPDVVCLQEVPVWALPRIDDWSGMRRFDAVTRPPLWPGPVSKWVTRAHQGFFRSGLAGQANAILVAPRHAATDLGHERISEHGRERRLVHAVRIAGSSGVTVANLHASNDHANPGVPRGEAMRAAAFAESVATHGDVVVIAGDFNVLDPALEAYAGTRDGIDQVLVRGARLESVVAWPHERRVQDGVVLSDHPVVEARIETETS